MRETTSLLPLKAVSDSTTRISSSPNPFALGTFAIVATYFCISCVSNFYSVPITYYMYDVLDLSADEVYVYDITLSMFECLRIVFVVGMLSFPVKMKRAKTFWAIGVCLFSLNYILLAIQSTGNKNISLVQFMTYALLGKVGENMMYGIVIVQLAERTGMESVDKRGWLVLASALVTEAGTLCGYMIDELFYSNVFDWPIKTLSIEEICYITAFVPLGVLLPAIYFYEESSSLPSNTVIGLCKELFASLASPDVFLTFLALEVRNYLELSNYATTELLLDGCGVDSEYYIFYKMGKLFAQFAGIWFYRKYFFSWDFVNVSLGVMLIFRAGDALIMFLSYNDGNNFIYNSPDTCMTYYGVINIIQEFANESKTQIKAILIYALSVSTTSRSPIFSVLLFSFDQAFSLMNDCVSEELIKVFHVTASNIEAGNLWGWFRVQSLIALVPIPFCVCCTLKIPRYRSDLDASSKAYATDCVDSKGVFSIGHRIPAAISTMTWGAGILFIAYWTYYSDKFGGDIRLLNVNQPDYWDQVFVALVLVSTYGGCCVISVVMVMGKLDWLAVPQRKDITTL